MSKFPVVSGGDATKAFGRIGYRLDHQTGSHMVLRHDSPPFRRLTVPNHRTLAKGTLHALIREAGLTVDQFSTCCSEVRQPRPAGIEIGTNGACHLPSP